MRPLVNSSGLFLFIGVRPPPFPKKPDETEKLYYYFQISASKYTLFDSELNTAIACGSIKIIGSYICKLPKTATVLYYKLDAVRGWKKTKSTIIRPKIDSEEKLVPIASQRPTSYPKKPNNSDVIFHYFKIGPTYVVFDSDMDTPVVYGNKLDVDATIVKLPKYVTIFYYESDTTPESASDSNTGWKLKRKYKPNKETEEDKTARDRITEKKKETVEEKTEKRKA